MQTLQFLAEAEQRRVCILVRWPPNYSTGHVYQVIRKGYCCLLIISITK